MRPSSSGQEFTRGFPVVDDLVAEAEGFRLHVGDAGVDPRLARGGEALLGRRLDERIDRRLELARAVERIRVAGFGDVGVGLGDVGHARSVGGGGLHQKRSRRRRRRRLGAASSYGFAFPLPGVVAANSIFSDSRSQDYFCLAALYEVGPRNAIARRNTSGLLRTGEGTGAALKSGPRKIDAMRRGTALLLVAMMAAVAPAGRAAPAKPSFAQLNARVIDKYVLPRFERLAEGKRQARRRCDAPLRRGTRTPPLP